jgi:hypothetical protein
MRPDIIPGATFPDHDSPTRTATLRGPASSGAKTRWILVLSRGSFCPKDHHQHLEIVELLPRIEVEYTKVATITTDEANGCREMEEATAAPWPFLSDPGRIVQPTTRWCRTHSSSHPSSPSTRSTAAIGSGAVPPAPTFGASSATSAPDQGRL